MTVDFIAPPAKKWPERVEIGELGDESRGEFSASGVG